MKQIISILIVFFEISVSIGYGNSKKNKLFDFSSVDAFFKVEEMLSNNIMPDYWTWNEMFQTKGYQLFGNPWSSLIIKEQMCNVFYKPDSGNINRILSIEIKKDLSNQADLLRKITLMNFIEIKAHISELKEFRNSLNSLNEEQIYDKAHQLLRDFLLIPIDSKMEKPKVAFAFFEPDAYNKESGIVMDFNQVFMNGQDAFIRILSHEMYHAYRRKFGNKKIIRLNEFTFQIDKLHNEGIADLLSKPSIDLEGSLLPQQVIDIYKEAFEDTPKVLEKLDSIVALYERGKINTIQLNNYMTDFFLFGGHPNGYYMAQLIIQQGFTEELKRSFYNPITFLKLYNNAARASNDYVFSDGFINYLNSLKKKYIN